jgi:hypothetical protein
MCFWYILNGSLVFNIFMPKQMVFKTLLHISATTITI